MLKIEKITKIFKFESVKATKKKDFSNYFAPQIISSVAFQYRKKRKLKSNQERELFTHEGIKWILIFLLNSVKPTTLHMLELFILKFEFKVL